MLDGASVAVAMALDRVADALSPQSFGPGVALDLLKGFSDEPNPSSSPIFRKPIGRDGRHHEKADECEQPNHMIRLSASRLTRCTIV